MTTKEIKPISLVQPNTSMNFSKINNCKENEMKIRAVKINENFSVCTVKTVNGHLVLRLVGLKCKKCKKCKIY